MVEARIAQLQRQSGKAEHLRDRVTRLQAGTLAVTQPHDASTRVKNGIARAFKIHAGRHVVQRIDRALQPQLLKQALAVGFFTGPLGLEITRQQHLAVQHHRTVGGKHQVGQPAHRRFDHNLRAQRLVLGLERGPAAARILRQPPGIKRPLGRVHPGVDGVTHFKKIGRAHQQLRRAGGVCHHGSFCAAGKRFNGLNCS